jgi:hypothetical protein
MEFSRADIIEYGMRNREPISNINATLQQAGYTDKFNPVVDLGRNLVENADRFARDFRSFTGALVQPVLTKGVKQAFMDAVQTEGFKRAGAGALMGAPLGIPGMVGGAMIAGLGPKNVINAMLDPYNTSIEDISQGKTRVSDVLAGAYRNPLYAGLDILGGPVSKGIGQASKNLGGIVKTTSPTALQTILPSKELRAFNRQLTSEISKATADSAKLYDAYNALDTMPMANRLEIVKNITTNTGELTKDEMALAKAIKKDLKANEQLAISKGFIDPVDARNETIGQYVMATIGPRVNGLLHMDVMDYLNRREVRPEVWELMIRDPKFVEALDDAITQGGKLYDENKITFLSQALAPTRDPFGNIVASDIAGKDQGYWGTKRIIGRTTAEDLSKVLDKSISHQLSQITRATNASDVVENIIGTKTGVGELITKDLKDIPANKIAINKEDFSKAIASQVSNGRGVDISEALRRAGTGKEGGYLVDRIYGEAIENAFKPVGSSGARAFNRAFKKAVLAQPHWVMLNRIGNFVNNSIGGVRLEDYLDAIGKEGRNLLPERLKQQTAFNSYVGAGIEGLSTQPKFASFKQPINRIIRATERFKDSGKGLSDIGKLARDLYAGGSDLTANPLFKLESHLERVDRYANFIRQAKREASATGKNWKDIVKKSSTDNKLYDKLNNQVNLDLGDYLGRNYAVPAEVYNALGLAVPFYRFLSQTGRTTFHQLANHPLELQAMGILPAKLGAPISEAVMEDYKLGKDYKGGVPYKPMDEFRNLRTVGIEPLPIQTVASDIANLIAGKDMPRVASPVLTMFGDIANYKKGGKYTPTSPRLTELKLTRPSEAQYYEPTAGEVYSYGANQLLGTTFNPYRWATIYGPELFSALTGRGLQSRYDTNPFVENPLSYRREGVGELIGKWGAVQTSSNYPEFKKRMTRSEARKASRNRRKLEKMKGNK